VASNVIKKALKKSGKEQLELGGIATKQRGSARSSNGDGANWEIQKGLENGKSRKVRKSALDVGSLGKKSKEKQRRKKESRKIDRGAQWGEGNTEWWDVWVACNTRNWFIVFWGEEAWAIQHQ